MSAFSVATYTAGVSCNCKAFTSTGLEALIAVTSKAIDSYVRYSTRIKYTRSIRCELRYDLPR